MVVGGGGGVAAVAVVVVAIVCVAVVVDVVAAVAAAAAAASAAAAAEGLQLLGDEAAGSGVEGLPRRGAVHAIAPQGASAHGVRLDDPLIADHFAENALVAIFRARPRDWILRGQHGLPQRGAQGPPVLKGVGVLPSRKHEGCQRQSAGGQPRAWVG